jgi:hypothetical protein
MASSLAPVPGRTVPGSKKSPRRNAERRCRVPLSLGNPGDKPRLLPRCAFRRSVSPQKGEIKLKPNSRGGARTKTRGCLKSESGTQSRCPGPMRHSSCRFAEPGPPQTPRSVRPRLCSGTAPQELRAALRPANAATYVGIIRGLDPRIHQAWKILAKGWIAVNPAITADSGERSYSLFGSFDMRSRRSCMSFIWRRRSSMLPASAAASGAAFSGSGGVELPPRGGTNGLNIENVC